MAKASTIFVCSSCGYESAKWLGKCPACNEWNSFYEEKISKNTDKKNNTNKTPAIPVSLNKVEKTETIRTKTGFDELDRVLGGGLVKGSLVLLRRRTWNWKINTYSTDMSFYAWRRKSSLRIW